MAKGDKYAGLRRYLEQCQEASVTMTFQEMESVLGFDLPKTARNRREFWANEEGDSRHSQLYAWRDAGYKTVDVDMVQEVLTFRKVR